MESKQAVLEDLLGNSASHCPKFSIDWILKSQVTTEDMQSNHRALYVLQIVRDECGLDGLTSSEIFKILSDKFRLNSTVNAISMALMNSKYVDRTQISTQGAPPSYRYRLMHAGEEYLNVILKNPSSKLHVGKDKTIGTSHSPQKRREGLKLRILTLVQKGFFEEAKSPAEVRDRLRTDGFSHDLEAIRTTLLRLVKRNQLARKHESNGNANGYKYYNIENHRW